MEQKHYLSLHTNERGYKFIKLFAGVHNVDTVPVWINKRIINPDDETISFPITSAKAIKTEKGNYVIVPDETCTTFLIRIPSGYRGWARIKEIRGGEVVLSGGELHSPRGSVGATAWALVVANNPIEVTAERSGRRISENDAKINIRVFEDGSFVHIKEDELSDLLS